MIKKVLQIPSFTTALFGVLLAALVFLPLVTHASFGNWVYNFLVVDVFGFFVLLSGLVLNYAINTFVVGFGTAFETGGWGTVVNNTWAILRDVFNLTFIFGLVYIGFKMILRSDDGNTRRWLVMLILAAMLVNFSLFISKFIVDFSNILAVEIINIGLVTEVGEHTVFGLSRDGGINISGSIQQFARLTSTYGQNDRLGADVDDAMGYIFGTLLVFIVAIFVYLSAALLLIIRGVVLIVLMIASPFLFIGMVFPPLMSMQKKLWNTLFQRAFFAPIYMLFLFISLYLAAVFMSGSSSATIAEALKPEDTEVTQNVFGSLIVVCAFLIMSLIAAKRIGAEGANTAMKVGNDLRRRGQGAAAGMGLRQVSRGAEVARNRYDRLDASRGGRALRTIAAVGTLGALSNNNVRSALNAGTKLSVSGSETLEQRRKRNAATTVARNEQAKEAKNQKARKDAENRIGDRNINAKDLNKAMDDFSGAFRDMSQSEREAQAKRVLDLLKDGQEDLAHTIAIQLKKSDFDAIEKAGSLALRDIDKLKDTRTDALKRVAREGTTISETYNSAVQDATFKDQRRAAVFSGMSTKDLGEMPVSVYAQSDMTKFITPNALEERMRNGGVSDKDFEDIEKNLQDLIETDSRAAKKWQNWNNRSNYGSQFDLDFSKAPNENQAQANRDTRAERQARAQNARNNINRPTS